MNNDLKTARCGLGPIYALAILEQDNSSPSYNGGDTRDDETASKQSQQNEPHPKKEKREVPDKPSPEPEIDQQPDPREKEIDIDDAAGPGQAGIEGDEAETDTDLIDTPRPDDD
ncbi:MAG: hypothetical protein ACTHZ7_14835 [Sphingobacterium sp.]